MGIKKHNRILPPHLCDSDQDFYMQFDEINDDSEPDDNDSDDDVVDSDCDYWNKIT